MKLIRTETKKVYESDKYKIEVDQVEGLEPELSIFDKEDGNWDKEFLCVNLEQLEQIRAKVNICIEIIKNKKHD